MRAPCVGQSCVVINNAQSPSRKNIATLVALTSGSVSPSSRALDLTSHANDHRVIITDLGRRTSLREVQRDNVLE